MSRENEPPVPAPVADGTGTVVRMTKLAHDAPQDASGHVATEV